LRTIHLHDRQTDRRPRRHSKCRANELRRASKNDHNHNIRHHGVYFSGTTVIFASSHFTYAHSVAPTSSRITIALGCCSRLTSTLFLVLIHFYRGPLSSSSRAVHCFFGFHCATNCNRSPASNTTHRKLSSGDVNKDFYPTPRTWDVKVSGMTKKSKANNDAQRALGKRQRFRKVCPPFSMPANSVSSLHTSTVYASIQRSQKSPLQLTSALSYRTALSLY